MTRSRTSRRSPMWSPSPAYSPCTRACRPRRCGNSSPGRRRTRASTRFASPGAGSLGHVNIENFMMLAKIGLLHVPYKGAGLALNDAVAGQVECDYRQPVVHAAPRESGRLRALAVLGATRSSLLPECADLQRTWLQGYGRWRLVRHRRARRDTGGHRGQAQRRHPQGDGEPGVSKQRKVEESGGTLVPTTPDQFKAQDSAGYGPLCPRGQGRQHQAGLSDDDIRSRTGRCPDRPFLRWPAPRVTRLPLVCDSPHSGVFYPDGLPRRWWPLARLRGGEDTLGSIRCGSRPKVGGTLVAPSFPQASISIPTRMLEGTFRIPTCSHSPWPGHRAGPGWEARLALYRLIWRSAGC